MDDAEPKNVKDLLVELKDSSELMVDLAYAAVFFNEEKLAEEVGLPVLGRIPFDPKLAAYADEGEPIVLAEPDAEVSRAIVALAEEIAATKREQGVGIVKSLPLVSA